MSDPVALEGALRGEGIEAVVEGRDALAVLRVADVAPLADDVRRARAIELARAHGFTTVAVEIDAAGATLPRA